MGRPTSVLIFPAARLAFADALAGATGHLDSKLSGVWILVFGTLNLTLVLLSLLYMFSGKPEFPIDKRCDLLELRAVEITVDKNSMTLVKERRLMLALPHDYHQFAES